jgi:nicotinamidase-related amidase
MEMSVMLRVPEPRAMALDPNHTALVLVDVENEFCRPKGRRYLGERAEQILAPLAALLNRARAAGVPIIYVHSVRDTDHPDFNVFKLDEYLIRGSWGAEYCEEIAPRADEPVIEKQSHDCFSHTEMEAVLTGLGIRSCEHTVIITGVALDVCVLHAVLGFSVRDYWVAVPTDTTAARTEQAEVVAYQTFMHPAYSYNVGLTRSELIDFRPGVGTPVAAAAVGVPPPM